MTSADHEKLLQNGWKEGDITAVAKNKLNEGIKALYTYKTTLSLRYHPDEKFIRLLIHNMNDSVGFQIAFEKDQGKIIDAIIALQDQFSVDNYFSQYMELQKVCDISILAIEQFL